MTDRITLRPAEAAAYLGCSTATIWRWSKTIEHFPKPERLAGRRVTFWYQDALDEWRTIHGTTRQNILALAWHRSDVVCAPANQAHPFITAYLLAGGGSLAMLAFESGLPEDRVRHLAQHHGDMTDKELIDLFAPAAAQVLYREKQIAERFHEAPARQHNTEFRREVVNLDEAHRICFGQRLLTHLLREGRANGDA